MSLRISPGRPRKLKPSEGLVPVVMIPDGPGLLFFRDFAMGVVDCWCRGFP